MTVETAAAIIAAESSGMSPQGVVTLAVIAVLLWAGLRPDKETREKKKKEKEKPQKHSPSHEVPALAPSQLPDDVAQWAVPAPHSPAPPLPVSPPPAPFFAPPLPDVSPEIAGSAFPFADLGDLPGTLGESLKKDAWAKMIGERGLRGLRMSYAEETPFGVDVHVQFQGPMSLKDAQNKVHQIEAGIDAQEGWVIQVKPGTSKQNGIIRIITRDPIKGFTWVPPTGAVRLADPLRVSRNGLGEDVYISVKQRIGLFGTSGSGKSNTQRIIGAHVIASVDADLEVWDLKFGLESQHYEGKAHRVTSPEDAVQRTQWLLRTEFPRRADQMRADRVSKWIETENRPALVVMIDEGNILTRDFTRDQLKDLFSAIEQGRALGVYFVWATQFPKADNLPTEIRSQLNCRISLLLLSSEESRVVYKDDVDAGWAPHKLIGPGWMLIKDADHRAPIESKAPELSEDIFRTVPLSGRLSGQRDSGQTAGQAPIVPLSVWDRILNVLYHTDLLSEDAPGVSELSRQTGAAKSTVSETLGRMESQGVVCRGGTDSRPTFTLPPDREVWE